MIGHGDEELFSRRQEDRSDMVASSALLSDNARNAEAVANMQRMAYADRGEAERASSESRQELNRQDKMREKRAVAQMRRINLAFRKLKTVKHVPEKSALISDYGSKFKSKYNDEVRASKQNNKRSRLFRKKENLKLITTAVHSVRDHNVELLAKAAGEAELVDDERIYDLSAFMTEDAVANAQLVKLFMGSGEDREGMDVREAMDIMFDSIMSVNIGNIRLENDVELCRNAAELEKLSAKIAAFDRLCGAEKYFSSFRDDDRAVMEEKLDRIRSVAYYYEARKELITDKYYVAHYNEELTMDVTSTNDYEQHEVALKLLKVYAAGKHMMQQNGMSQKKVNALGAPKFKNAQEGANYLKMYEEPLRLGKTKELLNENYLNRRDLSKAEYVRLNNNKIADAMNATALSNVINFKGNIEAQPGYKEPEYDAAKMKDLINEINGISITSIKGKNYIDMVENFNYNYEICERVRYLHSQVVRGLARGWEDPSFDDAAMVEFRAKTGFFYSFQKTMCAVNHIMAVDKESMSLPKEEFEKKLASKLNVQETTGFKFYIFTPGYPAVTYNKYRETYAEEDAMKDENIKITYRLLLADGNEEIPPAELERRKKQYNRNAIMQDSICKGAIEANFLVEPSSTYCEYLEKTTGKKSSHGRTIGAMIGGKSGEEVRRLFELSTGTDEQQYEYETMLIKEVMNCDLNMYDASDFGKLVDNFKVKERLAKLASDGLRDSLKHVKELVEKSDGALKIPDMFDSAEDMMSKGMVFYSFGQSIMAGRGTGISQRTSNRYLHSFSLYEMGNLSHQKIQAMSDRINGIDVMKLPEAEYEAYDVVASLPRSLIFVAGIDETRPLTKYQAANGMLSKIYGFKTSPEKALKNEQAFSDREIKWEKEEPLWQAEFPALQETCKEYNKEYDEILYKYDKEFFVLSEEEKARKDASIPERTYRAMVNIMSYLDNVDGYDDGTGEKVKLTEDKKSEMALDSYKKLTAGFDPKTEFPQFAQRVEEMNHVFDTLFSFDISEFEFGDIKELMSPAKMKLRFACVMAMDAENIFKAYRKLYKELQDSFTDESEEEKVSKMSLFAYDDFEGVLNRLKFLQAASDWYNKIPALIEDPISKDFNLNELLLHRRKEDLEELMEDGLLKRKYGAAQWMNFLSAIISARGVYEGTIDNAFATDEDFKPFFGPGIKAKDYCKAEFKKFYGNVVKKKR